MARSTAAFAPAMTIWPGALRFAALTTSPCAASAHACAIASASSPITAAIAPSPAGTASCMACARRRTSGTASVSVSTSAATSAAYSPRLCPATHCGTLPPAARQARQTAMPAVSISGWVLTVSASSLAGPSAHSCQRSWPRASEASRKVSRMTALSPYSCIMPTDCEPWPGNTNANAM